MDLIIALAVQGTQMALVLALAPLLLGFTRKVKARLLRRRGPPMLQPYRDLLRLIRKEVVLADNASWLFRSGPYMVFSATWVAAALVPTFATGLHFSWAADKKRHLPFAVSRRLLWIEVAVLKLVAYFVIELDSCRLLQNLCEQALPAISFRFMLGDRDHAGAFDHFLRW